MTTQNNKRSNTFNQANSQRKKKFYCIQILQENFSKEKLSFDNERSEASNIEENDAAKDEQENVDNTEPKPEISAETKDSNIGDDEVDKNTEKENDKSTIEEEIKELKKETKEIYDGVYFQVRKTDMPCMIFVQILIKEIKPSKFTELLFEYLRENNSKVYNKYYKYVIRLTPIDYSCSIDLSDIEAQAKLVVAEMDQVEEGQEPQKKYAVMFNKRATDKSVDRDEIIKLVATQVDNKHKVDLSNPELCILVEIFKNMCGFSVIDYYHKYNKLNTSLFMDKIMQQIKENKD